MANNCVVYATENQNGFRCYSSTTTSSSSTSSMGKVYADMSSLSLSPNYGVVSSVSSQESYISKRSEVENGRAFWGFPFHRNWVTRSSFEEHNNNEAVEGTGGSDNSDGNGENDDTLSYKANLEDDENPSENGVNGKETDSGHSKLCARGHWRPAEDSKLKELVALYGPQNWNLIAEKLEGRSGKESEEKSLIFLK